MFKKPIIQNEETPPDIVAKARQVVDNLIPQKSKKKYETAYKNFVEWKISKNVNNMSEETLVAYFSELAKTLKPSSLWAKYSMLRCVIDIKHKINIYKYSNLIAFLKQLNKGYMSTKAQILSAEQIHQFLEKAPVNKFLAIKVGYPCPKGMELSPTTITSSNGETFVAAECRCPPQTAQFARDGQCYKLFDIGPCERGEYFAPDSQYESTSQSSRRWGICKHIEKCPNRNEIFWPQDEKCYLYLTKGPCIKGQLITLGIDKIAVCRCNHKYEMRKYWSTGNGCFEHFTRGPCRENGHLFLPDRSCGCHSSLPHFHNHTQLCYEIGSIGPCNSGEQFQLDPTQQKAVCHCKKGYIRFNEDLNCYRPYTQGPCKQGYILVNTTSCIKQPCEKGYLYYPANTSCYRIGTQGPCKNGHVITFDFKTRPSVDGISYNGLCQCKNSNCDENEQSTTCADDRTVVLHEKRCFKLYSQGPCQAGAWLTLKRQSKIDMWEEHRSKEGVCECMPGYKKKIQTENNINVTQCIGPTVVLAEFLNKNYFTLTSSK